MPGEVAARPLPAKERPDDKRLPRLQRKAARVAGPVVGIGEPDPSLDKPERVIGGGGIKREPQGARPAPVAHVPRARVPHIRPGDDAPVEDVEGGTYRLDDPRAPWLPLASVRRSR